MPYIKLEDAKKAIAIDNVHKSIIEAMQSFLDDIPKADVEEVQHARWHFDGVSYECSACKEVYRSGYNYCPWCGAKMDLEGEEK